MTTTILVIDDSVDEQRLCRRAFKDFDDSFSMVMASSAEAGLARIADVDSKRPDLILLDYNLPDMDGLSFMKKLAEYSATPIPIVMLTGEGSTEVAVEAMKHGAGDYLVKDTGGRYLKLLPGMAWRVMATHAQYEQARLMLREHEIMRASAELEERVRQRTLELTLSNQLLQEANRERERVLQQTETLLRRNQTLMQNSMDGIHIMDMRGNIVEANDAFCRMLGYTPKEMARLNVADWDAQWSAEELRERFKWLIGKSERFETVHRRKNGSLIDVEISTSGMEIEGQYFLYAASRDITERKRAEGVLKLNQTIIETAYDGFWLFDTNGYLLEANQAYANMIGYTREELVGKHISQLSVQSNTPELVRARVEKAIGHGLSYFETQHRHKDGHIVDFEASIAYIPEAECLFSFIRDITGRKKTEAMLRQHKAVIDTSIDGFWVSDMRGYVREANQAYAKMSGYTVEELVNMHISQLEAIELKPEDVQAHIAKVVAQGYDLFETRHRHKDGHEIDIEVSATYMAEPEQLFVFCRDITGRKRASLEAHLNQNLLKEAQRLGKLGSWELDLLSGVLRWSDEMYRIFEIDPARFMHTYEDFLGVIHPDDRDKVNQAYTQSLRDRQHYDVVHRLLLPDGRIKWVHEHCASDFDVAGKPLRSTGMTQDITERKRAEEAKLRESDLRFRGTLEQVGVGIVHASLDGYFKQINQKFCEIVGYARDELIHKDFRHIIFPDDLDEHIHYIQKLLAGEIPAFSMEKRYVRKDRSLVWVNLTVSLLRDADGTPTYTIGVIEDITERKQAEVVVQQFGSLLQGSFNEIYMFDADSLHFILTSAGAEKNLGYSDDELNRLTPLDIGPLFTRESFEQLVAPLWSGAQQSLFFETVQRRKDGTTYPVEVSLQLMRNDHATFLAVVQDITERKQAEIKLHKFAEKIEDLYNNAPCGYHSLGKDGTILMINETELAWLGYARDEVVGKMKLTDLLSPEGRQTFHETFPQFIKRGFIHDIELELTRKDGTVLSGLISATAIYDLDGNFVMSRSTLADITGLKRVEQRLRDLTAHLQSVREEEKAGIAREIHDDLGGTLTALKIETYWLKTEQPKGKEATPFLERVESMSKLIDNAMGVMRSIVTGLRPTVLDDLGLLAALEWQAAQFHKHTGIECRVNCVCAAVEECTKELDKARSIALFRIAQEALNNVAKHSGASQVEIEFLRNDEEVVMSVIDNGCGMAEKRTDVSIPYGILGMCERADQLGGKISFDTPPGGGFNVTVILPLPGNDEEIA